MKKAEPRKLFGRPSSLLLDEGVLPGVPPLIRIEPPRAFAESASEMLGGMKIRSVASLPDDLEDPDELDEPFDEGFDVPEDTLSTEEMADDSDDTWGAAFEVDDFRAARRVDPDADLLTGPATIRMAPPPSAADEEEEMIGMPEEGDEPEHTGVGEQVSLPEGFGEGLLLAGDDGAGDDVAVGDAGDEDEATVTDTRRGHTSVPTPSDPPPSPAPGPFEAMRRSPYGLGLGRARLGAAPPRVLTEDPVEGLAVAWMSASSELSDDLPEIMDDHHVRSERRRDERQALLSAAVVGDPQRRTAVPEPAAAPGERSQESAPGPEPTRTASPASPARAHASLPSPTPDPAADLIPDAVSALAEALERNPASDVGVGPRARRPTGEPPRISRRTREEPAPPAVPLRRRQPEAESEAPTPRRLARPTMLPGAAPEGERRARPAPVQDAPHRREGPDTAPRPRRPLSPVVMPAPSFAPEPTPQPPPAPVSTPSDLPPAQGRVAPARPNPARTAQRAPARARPARVAPKPPAEVNPALVGLALVVGIIGLLALIVPRLRAHDAPPPVQASGPMAPAVVAPTLPAPRADIPAPEQAALPPAPTPAPVDEEKPPVVAAPPPPLSKPSEKASAYKVALGIIRVTSDRKALIIVDGKQQGYAPGLEDISVMPGQHTVRAVVSGTGLSRSLEIRVDAGSAVVASFSFAAK